MKLYSILSLTLLIAPLCYGRPIPAHVKEIIPEIEIDFAPSEEQNQNAKQQIILQGITNILAGVKGIVSEPRNKNNVRDRVTGILANIINIALIARKNDHRSRLEIFTIICDELDLDDATREIIKLKIEKLNPESA